ncbi:50S ribosomal protein L32 [Cellulomonas phragmiteti]|nr:50S ribosomal protein L32 [Cellulomonas phragmiteti]
MAVPKRKMSRSRTRSRRAQWGATATPLTRVRVGDRDVVVPPRLVPALRRGLIDPQALPPAP